MEIPCTLSSKPWSDALRGSQAIDILKPPGAHVTSSTRAHHRLHQLDPFHLIALHAVQRLGPYCFT